MGGFLINCTPLVRDGLCTCRQDTSNYCRTSSSYAMYNDPYHRGYYYDIDAIGSTDT